MRPKKKRHNQLFGVQTLSDTTFLACSKTRKMGSTGVGCKALEALVLELQISLDHAMTELHFANTQTVHESFPLKRTLRNDTPRSLASRESWKGIDKPQRHEMIIDIDC